MKTEHIVAKAKGKEVASADINWPENLAEAIAAFADKEGKGGEERVYKLAMQQYKIGELNRIRDLATGGAKIPKAILDRLRGIADPSQLATVCQLMGINPDDVTAAIG